ncbi:T9SS type A sorting domain-containing protein [Labilibaculum sp. A4]|uniref:endonuclease n=1 Tax=Labilibaculum euxinus TaxID=2686357 RepID=UPI000F61F017|nr:endonuclease [Labilibaculum euxinus]MDQ1770077.1 endonuclease [Labilibaculum euxinus]MWN77498.1 T9SS type A sorting domain-containing protein [Labilibaculum euxinus]
MIRTLHVKILFFLSVFVAFALSATAQTSIEEYYQNAAGKTGDELKTALHSIIRNHTELPYTTKDAGDQYNVWEALKITDEDPTNTDNILLIYTGRSEVKTRQDDGVSNDPDSWNREHIWAKSHGDFGTERGAGTDIHHLRACDRSVNTDRSNKFFDNGGTVHSEAAECKFDGDSWEPRDAVKGDIARMILYMAVCYEGENGDPDLEMTNDMTYSMVNYSAPFFGKLSTLLVWNTQDPVDEAEKARNEKVYTIQGNRNPFIDYPEWADEIWPPDTESPAITELSPVNNSIGVSLTANLIIKFNEDIKEGTGSVTIKRYNDETTFETLTIPSARLTYSGNQLLINSEAKYEEGVRYYVVIDNGVVTDASSNAFDGISDKTIWNFTATYTPPVITEFTPADKSENIPISTNLKITFDKEVQAGNGSIRILTNGSETAIAASDALVTYNGTQVSIDLSDDLETGTEYYINIDNNAFVSAQDIAFAGISTPTDWSFTTENPTGIDDVYTDGIPSFYPNPAVNEIRLKNMNDVESMYISNLTGRNIMEIKSPDTRISISKLPKGMYFVTFVTFDGKRITKKLLKQ